MHEQIITIADFLAESEVWEYSKERFLLLKECGELSLLEAYSDTENYIVENAETLTDTTFDLLMVEAGSTVDKLASYLSSSPRMKTKLAEKRHTTAKQIFDLLQTISKVNLTFWNKASDHFNGKRKDRIISLNSTAGKLLEQSEKSGIKPFKLPATPDKQPGIELVKSTFDNDTYEIRKFNDKLKEFLTDNDYKMLKTNEGWLAPKFSVQQSKAGSVIAELLTETSDIVGSISDIRNPLEIVKNIDVLSARIAGIKSDATITFVNSDTFNRTCKALKTADDKLNENIKTFMKNEKSSDTETAYGAIFTALTSLITQLRWATKTAIKSEKSVLDRIGNAIEFQQRVMEQAKN